MEGIDFEKVIREEVNRRFGKDSFAEMEISNISLGEECIHYTAKARLKGCIRTIPISGKVDI